MKRVKFEPSLNGRWPANVIHDGSQEVLNAFALYGDRSSSRANGNLNNPKHGKEHNPSSWSLADGRETTDYRDSGTAARFFYCAKASKADREYGLEHIVKYKKGKRQRINIHPTVKPIALMEYLIRLVTPPKCTILDPFMGSGTTGIAALRENTNFIGIEQSKKYFRISKLRIRKAQKEKRKHQLRKLFDAVK